MKNDRKESLPLNKEVEFERNIGSFGTKKIPF